MTERERFEEYAIAKGWNVKKWDDIHYENAQVSGWWFVWQTRAKIAEKDQAELVEALISLRFVNRKDYWITDEVGIRKTNAIVKIEELIEKHTGKPWEQIVEERG